MGHRRILAVAAGLAVVLGWAELVHWRASWRRLGQVGGTDCIDGTDHAQRLQHGEDYRPGELTFVKVLLGLMNLRRQLEQIVH